MQPQPPGMAEGRHAVGQPGEDEAAVEGHLALHRQRRHHPVDLVGPGPEHAAGVGQAGDVGWAVAPDEVGQVDHGDAGDDARQIVFEGGDDRRHQPAQRVPDHADLLGALLLAQPADDAPHVPGGLGHAVHAVDHVDGHEVLAPAPARGPGPVQRQDRHDHVDAPPCQLRGPEGAQVHGGVVAHAEAVGAHQPRAVVTPGTRDTQACTVWLASCAIQRAQPGSNGFGLPPAREGGMLEAQPAAVLVPGVDVVRAAGGSRWYAPGDRASPSRRTGPACAPMSAAADVQSLSLGSSSGCRRTAMSTSSR